MHDRAWLRSTGLRVLAASSLFAVVSAQGRQPPPPPPQSPQVFRSGVNLVPIDVRVLDRSGAPITDLTASDFVVLENNVRQQIRHFSTTTLEPVLDAPTGRLVRTEEAPALGTQSHRVFLLVMGRGRLQAPVRGVDAAIDLIRNHLLPQDYVGVLAWNRATDFTTDHAKTLAVVERFKKRHEKIEALLRQHFSGLAAVYAGPEIPPGIQTEINAVFEGPERAGVRELPASPVTDARGLSALNRRTTDALQTQTLNAASGSTMATSLSDTAATIGVTMGLDEFVELGAQSMQDITNLYTGISYLRHIAGEKHLLFVSEFGVFAPRAEDDRGIAAAAADARVVLNILHTGGTRSGGSGWATQTSQTIAELSGGQFTSVQSGSAFVNRLDASSRFQYSLGYYPTNSVMDSRYRRITIRVNRPGARVLYRHGYFARQFQSGFDRQRMVTYSRVTTAATYGGEIRDLAIKVNASATQTAQGRRQVTVQVQIPTERLALTEANGRRRGSIDVVVFCADANQWLIGTNWETIEFEITPDAYQRFLQQGLTYSGTVDVSAQPRHVKVVIYDAGADLVGSTTVRIK